MKRLLATAGIIFGLVAVMATASAQYKREPDSEIDPSLFRIRIDEMRYLRVPVNRSLALLDELGQPLILGVKNGPAFDRGAVLLPV
ncbi:MAG: hypothetical protein FD153_1816 [Rhodospirillaceae bacterium]|nr:MAG: hypothetical protein FD153_1816 [Rhodospirillaceae bacterium]